MSHYFELFNDKKYKNYKEMLQIRIQYLKSECVHRSK